MMRREVIVEDKNIVDEIVSQIDNSANNNSIDNIAGNNGSEAQDTKDSKVDSKFRTIKSEIKEIQIDKIRNVESIPEYLEVSESVYPIVVSGISEEEYACIEGWKRIQEAIEQGQTSITCCIYYVEEISDIDLAIRKIAVRVKPEGGISTYAERIRNIKIVFNMLMESLKQEGKNPVLFSQGGARRGIKYTENKEDNIQTLLEERLGLTREKINLLLSFGRYISISILGELVERDVSKRFFEAIRPHKRQIVDKFKQKQKSDADIEAEISSHVLTWFEKFNPKTKKIELEPESPATPDTSATTPSSTKKSSTQKPKTFDNPTVENPATPLDDKISETKKEIEESSKFIMETATIADNKTEIVANLDKLLKSSLAYRDIIDKIEETT